MVTLAQLTPYFAGKRVLLTGHTGFKGSWMLQVLARMGAKVCGYSLAPINSESLYEQIDGDSLCAQSVIEDICDSTRLAQTVISFEPDYIFHMAAQPLVLESYDKPLYTFNVNAQGTANLLDAVKQLSNKCVVVCITTDKVYHNPEDGKPFVETDKLGGYDPYSASKAGAEIVIQSYRYSFFNANNYDKHLKSLASVRAGNVIGGGDYSANRIVPDIVRSLQQEKPVTLRNPNAVRPWQHVIEPLSGYLLLASKMWDSPTQYADAYNFGPATHDVLTVEALVKEAIAIFEKGSYTISEAPTAHEAQLLMLDIAKVKTELSWQPQYTALESIRHTVNWYKDPSPADVKCLSLINDYFSASINHANDD